MANSGCTRATAAGSPPTMKTSSAFLAPASAPETGASTMATPMADRRVAVRRVSQGSEDEVSRSKAPRLKPVASPSVPKVTVSTSRPFGSMVMTMSDAAATAPGVAEIRASGIAAFTRSSTAESISKTLTG